jgi:hypothetical protein
MRASPFPDASRVATTLSRERSIPVGTVTAWTQFMCARVLTRVTASRDRESRPGCCSFRGCPDAPGQRSWNVALLAGREAHPKDYRRNIRCASEHC